MSSACPHSNWTFWPERVGADPLKTQTFIKMSGPRPTQIKYFNSNEWAYSLCKLTYNVRKCCKIKILCIFTDYLPTRFIAFTKNEWVPTHSKHKLLPKRVGADPLKIQTFTKMSGLWPTQIEHFDPNEWTPTHSNCKLLLKRVDPDPLKTQTFTKTSGPRPTRNTHSH